MVGDPLGNAPPQKLPQPPYPLSTRRLVGLDCGWRTMWESKSFCMKQFMKSVFQLHPLRRRTRKKHEQPPNRVTRNGNRLSHHTTTTSFTHSLFGIHPPFGLDSYIHAERLFTCSCLSARLPYYLARVPATVGNYSILADKAYRTPSPASPTHTQLLSHFTTAAEFRILDHFR